MMIELIKNKLCVNPEDVSSTLLDAHRGELTITMKSGTEHFVRSVHSGYADERVSASAVYDKLLEASTPKEPSDE